MSLITKVRVANTSRTVEAEVVPCSFADVVAWHRHIHIPFVAQTRVIGSQWDWPALYLGCHVSEQTLGRQALAFQVRVSDTTGHAVPIAQALVSLPYPWPAAHHRRCVFLWFLAATPATALHHFGIRDRFSTLPPLLDVAVQVSLSHGLEGRIGLHAALGHTTKESDALAARYEREGLKRRSRLSRFFRFPHRKDDGRLFYFGPEDAKAFAARQDDLR